jgi:hypothetical protein
VRAVPIDRGLVPADPAEQHEPQHVVLGLLWTTTVLAAENEALQLEHLVRASWADLSAAAVVSVPLLAVGILTVARAGFLGVTCTDAEVKVHKMLWTRRVPAERRARRGGRVGRGSPRSPSPSRPAGLSWTGWSRTTSSASARCGGGSTSDASDEVAIWH